MCNPCGCEALRNNKTGVLTKDRLKEVLCENLQLGRVDDGGSFSLRRIPSDVGLAMNVTTLPARACGNPAGAWSFVEICCFES